MTASTLLASCLPLLSGAGSSQTQDGGRTSFAEAKFCMAGGIHGHYNTVNFSTHAPHAHHPSTAQGSSGPDFQFWRQEVEPGSFPGGMAIGQELQPVSTSDRFDARWIGIPCFRNAVLPPLEWSSPSAGTGTHRWEKEGSRSVLSGRFDPDRVPLYKGPLGDPPGTKCGSQDRAFLVDGFGVVRGCHSQPSGHPQRASHQQGELTLSHSSWLWGGARQPSAPWWTYSAGLSPIR